MAWWFHFTENTTDSYYEIFEKNMTNIYVTITKNNSKVTITDFNWHIRGSALFIQFLAAFLIKKKRIKKNWSIKSVQINWMLLFQCHIRLISFPIKNKICQI